MPGSPGHGDHWLAALPPGDGRLLEAVAPPLDAPGGVALLRQPLTEALDFVQVTQDRRLVTAYPEPRATSLVEGRPLSLSVWETGVEAWLTFDHAGAGALTVFLTDFAREARRYARASGVVALEVAGLAYAMGPPKGDPGPARLFPASRKDARFLPDDYGFVAEVVAVEGAGGTQVVEARFQGGLSLPVVARTPPAFSPGDVGEGYLWLTGRLREGAHGQ